jgi:hypothetical protein
MDAIRNEAELLMSSGRKKVCGRRTDPAPAATDKRTSSGRQVQLLIVKLEAGGVLLTQKEINLETVSFLKQSRARFLKEKSSGRRRTKSKMVVSLCCVDCTSNASRHASCHSP